MLSLREIGGRRFGPTYDERTEMSDVVGEITMKLETRLEELLLEEKQLQAALAEMCGGRGATHRPRKAQGRRLRKGTRARRGQRRDELLAALKEQPGARAVELSDKLGISPAQVSTLLKGARKEKLVSKKGRGYTLKSA